MAGIADLIGSYLGGGALNQIAERAGLSPEEAADATQAAVPALAAGIAREAHDPQRAAGLFNALEKDHDGSVLLAGNHPQQQKGEGILQHVFGGRQQAVAEGVSKATGLSMSKVLPLLIQLAPIVMGALGKEKRERNVASPEGLGGLLGDILGGNDAAASVAGKRGGLGGLLDADNDGQIIDDVAEMGSKVLSGGGLGGLLGGLKRK